MRSPPPAPVRAAVLVVAHDPLLGDPLVAQLAADGHAVRLARSGEHARTLARAAPPELVILGGLERARAAHELLIEIRTPGRSEGGAAAVAAWVADLPVIVLGADPHEAELLRAFAAGADDFLLHPVSYLELRARLHAVLARAARPRSSTLVCAGALTIDTDLRAVSLHGRRVPLRRREYELLLTLARDPERV